MTRLSNGTALHRVARWLVVACVAAALLVQAVSAIVADLLGPRHSHASLAVASTSAMQEPMASWRDFRRVQHDHQIAEVAADAAHAHAHEADGRHHHDSDDRSVIKKEATGFEDGALADIAQTSVSFVFLGADGAAQASAPAEAFGTPWRTRVGTLVPTPCPWRIERPPSRT